MYMSIFKYVLKVIVYYCLAHGKAFRVITQENQGIYD